LEYETSPNGNVYYIDENGVRQTVAGENWGPGNPSDELADYLDETDHPWGATDEDDPSNISDATREAIDAIISDIVNSGGAVEDSPYYDVIGSDGDYTGYSFETAYAIARERAGGAGGTFTWNGTSYITDTKEEVDSASWSNPSNWIITSDERGDLQKQYIGNRDVPANGDYTVPSFADINSGTADPGSSIPVIIENGQAYVTDVLGNKYTNVDAAATNDVKISSYEDSSNYTLTLDSEGNTTVVYSGDYSAPILPDDASDYLTQIKPTVEKVRELSPDLVVGSVITPDIANILDGAMVGENILPSDLAALADAGYTVSGDVALEAITGASPSGDWTDRRSATKALSMLGYTTMTAEDDVSIIPGAVLSKPLRTVIGSDEQLPDIYYLTLPNGTRLPYSQPPSTEEVLLQMRNAGYDVEPLVIPKGTNLALAEDAMAQVVSDLELTPVDPIDPVVVNLITLEEYNRLFSEAEQEIAENNLEEYAEIKADDAISKDTIDSLLDKGFSLDQIVDMHTTITGGNTNPDGSSVEVMAANSAFSDSTIKDESGNAAIMYRDPTTGELSRTPTGTHTERVFVDATNPLTVDGLLTESGSSELVEVLGEDRVEELREEYVNEGTVTITEDDKEKIENAGNDSVVINDTETVTVVDDDNTVAVSEDNTNTGNTTTATRPEWKNQMDLSYNTHGGFNLSEFEQIAQQYNVSDSDLSDYYKYLVPTDQPWKQEIMDKYLESGSVDYETIKQIEQDYNVTTNEFSEFYKKLSTASADGFDAGILDAFETEIEDLGDTIDVLEGQLDTAQSAADWVNSQLEAGESRTDIINTLKAEGGFSQTEAAKLHDSINGFRETISGLEGDIEGLEGDVDTLTGERDFAEGAYQTVNSAWEAGSTRDEIINDLMEGGFDSASAATLVDTVKQIRDTDAQLREEKGFAQGAYEYINNRLTENATREEVYAELIDGGYTESSANAALDAAMDVYEQKAQLYSDVSFSQGAYGLVQAQLEAGKTAEEIVELLSDNNFPTDLAQALVDSIQTYRDTISGLEGDVETSDAQAQFAQGAYDFINGQLDAASEPSDVVAELVANGYTETEAAALVENIKDVRDKISDLDTQVSGLEGDLSAAQNSYSTINTALDADTAVEDIVAGLVEDGFSESDATELVNAIKNNRDAFTTLESTQETTAEQRQFAQQAYDYINGQLDAETSLEQIVEDLVENGYTESGATALVTNISDMRTNLANVESELGTAQANQLFGQTAYTFVNEQLDIIDSQDPDSENLLSESDIIQSLVENGFSEANASTLVDNISTIRTTEGNLRDQVSSLEAENTFVEGAYNLVTSRLDAMDTQDGDGEDQITPETIVDELVAGGFDETSAQNLVDSIVGIRDQVNTLNMQLDTLGTEANFAQRAYTYVNTMFDEGKTAEEIQNSLVEKGFTEDTAATLVTGVNDTRTTLSGLETDLSTAQDQRTFAQRAFEFVNQQLDGEVSSEDIIEDLVENGFTEVDATALVTDAVDIRTNTDLLNANNAFAQGAYGFINEQLEAGSETTDIIQELVDNGFDYTKAETMVSNIVGTATDMENLSEALGIMETRQEFAQTAYNYIDGQLEMGVLEDDLLRDLVENYGYSADNAQALVDTVQGSRFDTSELERLKTSTTAGTTFDFAVGEGGQGGPGTGDGDGTGTGGGGVFTAATDRPGTGTGDGDGTGDGTGTGTNVGDGEGDGVGDGVGDGTGTGGGGGGGTGTGGTGVDVDDDTYVGGQPVELDEFGNPILRFGPFDRPLGTYSTLPIQPVGPFDAYAMQMPEEPVFDPQQARLGPQPTEVTLDEAGFVTEPVAYIPEEAPTDPTMYYSPQFKQCRRALFNNRYLL